MQLNTKYFGPIAYDPADVLQFPQGLFAFEAEKEFLLLPFADSEGALLCLQSLSTPNLAFVVMNPFSLAPSYAPALQARELRELEAERDQDLCFYTLCVVKDPISDSTVNLRCPVVINDRTHRAMQVILDTADYHMRHPLSEFQGKGAEAPC